MENYVTSRELAERLKAAGYSQENCQHYWDTDLNKLLTYQYRFNNNCAAPLSDELLEQLPDDIVLERFNDRDNQYYLTKKGYYATWSRQLSKSKQTSAKKPADALAELWLWCKEQGYIK